MSGKNPGDKLIEDAIRRVASAYGYEQYSWPDELSIVPWEKKFAPLICLGIHAASCIGSHIIRKAREENSKASADLKSMYDFYRSKVPNAEVVG